MDKFVIYFAGGTMRGVFGAGVATAFQEQNIYPKISAVYGASAGVMIGAYFLSRQTKLGSSIFWEDLGKEFISHKDFFTGVWQRFQYVKLFNLDTHVIEYIDARRPDILEILKAGVNAFPYVHEISVIDGKRYVDAAIMDIVGFDFLRQKYLNKKIIIVMNGQTDRKLRYRMKNILEGKFMQWMFDDPAFYNLYASAEDKLARDLEKIKSDPNSLLITQEKDVLVRSRTTDAKLLLEMYNSGIEAGNRALQSSFMNS